MWPLYLALKQLFPTGKRFPFFTVIATGGVALGVTVLLVVTSVMSGFGYEIRKMIVETQGDVQIRPYIGGIRDADSVIKQLMAVPGVEAATPFAEGFVVVDYAQRPSFPAIQGVDVERIEKVVPLSKYIVVGSLDDLDDDSIILSADLARSLGATVGDEVEVVTPLMVDKIKRDEVLLPRALRVAGIFQIGHQALDSSLVICTLRLMQDLYGLGTEVHGINVRIAPDLDANDMALKLTRLLDAQGLQARSWMELNRDFLFVVQLEKNMMLFLMFFIVVVAAFSVMSSLLISVVRKTREIGLLGALGGRPRDVALCFCAQGLFIGVVGTALGLAGGFAALGLRNKFVDLVASLTHSREALERFYQFTNLPAHTEVSDVVIIVTATIIVATLAGVIPAWRAARLRPVEALRSE